MDEPRTNHTDQQSTNAALAALAASGNSFALGQLWEINKSLLHSLFWQWYNKNKSVADSAGLTMEDFDQEAFFAVQAAAKAYDPEKGSFTTLLSYYVQSQINRAVLGEHSCIEITEEGKRVRKSANLLNSCTSLDVHLDINDENTTVRSDLIEDPAASRAFQNVEDNNYTEKLHNDLEKAIDTLPRRQADIIRRHYFAETPLADIAREDGISSSAVHTSEHAALYTLSKNRTLLRWHDEIISERAWNGTGFCAWKSHGSVQERTVEYLEEQMPKMERELEERRAFLERMIQLAPEHREAIERTSLYKDAFKSVVNSVVSATKST